MSDPRSLGKLKHAAAAVVAWAASCHVPMVVIGGIAVSILSKPRTTKDIDVVAWLPDHDAWPRFLADAERHGISPRIPNPIEFALRSRVLLLQHQESAVPIDVSFAALPFEENAIRRAVQVDVGELRIPLPVVEDLLVMKAIAHRPRDLADIEAILSVHPTIDETWVLTTVREFANLLESPEIAADLAKLLRNRGVAPGRKRKRSVKRSSK